MARVTSWINTTPDGFADGPYLNPDAEYFDIIHEVLENVEIIAFGRNTFEMFQEVWTARLTGEDTPDWQLRMARALNETPKQVYSSRLNATRWNNSKIVRTMDVDEVKRFKQESKKGLLTFGSLALVAELAEKKLVDDYYFCIQTILAGGGSERLFDRFRLNGPEALNLKSTRVLRSGMVILHYERAA